MKHLLPLWLLITLSFCGFSQSTEEMLLLGNEAKEAGLYQTAYNHYTKVFKSTKDADVAYLCAESARQANNYEKALQWYSTYLSIPQNGQENPLAYFYKAQMLQHVEKLRNAIDTFNLFIQLPNVDNLFYQKAQKEIEACQWALQNQDTAEVAIEHLNNRVNTKNSESSALLYSDSLLLFVSLRSLSPSNSQNDNFMDELILSSLYQSIIDKRGRFGVADLNKWKISSEDQHLGGFCFDRKNNRIYLSYCHIEGFKAGNCEIFFSDLKNGKWSKPQKLSEEVNQNGFSSSQPAVAYDDNKVILYFSSNRPNGLGSFDIWYSLIEGDKCSPAVNLGTPVNTEGNEITPFYHQDSACLYFSSDNHPGFGGYDVFVVKGKRNTWEKVKNMHKPVNSPANDFYFNIDFNNSEKGFITSNRKSSYHIENETCCNDIYRWKTAQKATPEIQFDTLPKKIVSEKPSGKKDEIRSLLPLSLYFHNDEPNPKTLKITSEETYSESLHKYKEKKPLYLKAFEKDSNKVKEQKDIENFFSKKVDSSYKSLTHFFDLLFEDLSTGHHIILTVKGYASPLYIDSYNENLSKRRISSLVNELLAYKNGEVRQYLNSENASLEIVELALGSSTADSLVGRNPADVKSSIYSIEAAQERRVDILSYSYRTDDSTSNQPLPILEIENTLFSLGYIPAKKKLFFEIPLKNNSSTTQEIEYIDAACSCIKVNYSKILEPHKNVILTLEIDSSKGKKGSSVIVPLSIKLKSEKTSKTLFVEYSIDN